MKKQEAKTKKILVSFLVVSAACAAVQDKTDNREALMKKIKDTDFDARLHHHLGHNLQPNTGLFGGVSKAERKRVKEKKEDHLKKWKESNEKAATLRQQLKQMTEEEQQAMLQQATLDAVNKQNQSCEQQLQQKDTECKEKLYAVHQENQSYKQEMLEVLDTLEEQNKSCEQQLNTLQKDNDDMQDKLGNVYAAEKQFEETEAKLEADIENQNKIIKQIKDQNKKVQTDNQELAEKMHKMQQENDTLRAKHKEWGTRWDERNAPMSDMKNDLEASLAEIDDKKNIISEKDNEIYKLTRLNEELESKNKEQQKQIEYQAADISFVEELHKKNKQLEEENRSLQEENDRLQQ